MSFSSEKGMPIFGLHSAKVLYEMYRHDLIAARAFQRLLYPLMFETSERMGRGGPAFSDIEAELTYLYIRALVPTTVVEIGSGSGWSTSWILHALKDNGAGKLYSFDIVDTCTYNVPKFLREDRWCFLSGNVFHDYETSFPIENIDYIFIDAEHTDVFAWWYTTVVFPMVRERGMGSAHDIFFNDGTLGNAEGGFLVRWLKEKGCPRFGVFEFASEIEEIRKSVGITDEIHTQGGSSVAFFALPEITAVNQTESFLIGASPRNETEE